MCKSDWCSRHVSILVRTASAAAAGSEKLIKYNFKDSRSMLLWCTMGWRRSFSSTSVFTRYTYLQLLLHSEFSPTIMKKVLSICFYWQKSCHVEVFAFSSFYLLRKADECQILKKYEQNSDQKSSWSQIMWYRNCAY